MSSEMGEGHALWYLCSLGFFKEFRPSESFLTQYLVGPKNFTQEEVSQEIYPIGTYSTFLLLIAVFLCTDVLCYKPVIIVHSLAGVTCYFLITYGTSKSVIQTAEIFYGLFLASEIAYSTYMYASCEKDLYQKVTSYTRIALQAGRLIAGCVAQLLISSELLDFHDLNYLSLAGLLSSVLFGFLLPSTHSSLYFHRVACEQIFTDGTDSSLKNIGVRQIDLSADANLLQDKDEVEGVKQIRLNESLKLKTHDNLEQISGFRKIWSDFLIAFSSLYIVKWSLWWSLTTCGYLQVSSYMQNLWQDTVDLTNDRLYNGAASATYTILGIMASWMVGQLQIDFSETKSQWLLSICASLSGLLIISSALSYILVVQYVAYGAFKILYQIMMIFANTEVAKSLTRDSHGLIFGFNTFIALVLQSILTATVAGKGGLQLPTRLQFLVYGAYFIVIGCGFGVVATYNSVRRCCQLRDASQSDVP